MKIIRKHQNELFKTCDTHNVNELYVFGSVLRDDFNTESDLDFIVSIFSKDPIEYAENYFGLKFDLERIFDRKIDLLEERAMENQTLKSIIDQSKRIVYAGEHQGVA